jgi:hypothetical protein
MPGALGRANASSEMLLKQNRSAWRAGAICTPNRDPVEVLGREFKKGELTVLCCKLRTGSTRLRAGLIAGRARRIEHIRARSGRHLSTALRAAGPSGEAQQSRAGSTARTSQSNWKKPTGFMISVMPRIHPQEKIDELCRQANTDYFDIMLMHYQHVATWPTDTVRWQDGILEGQSKKVVVGHGASVHGLPALRQFPGEQVARYRHDPDEPQGHENGRRGLQYQRRWKRERGSGAREASPRARHGQKSVG